MARPRNDAEPNLSSPCNLTVGAIDRLTCPPDKDQAFLRDVVGNGLKVRVAPTGTKTFVFEQRLNGKTVRRAIGSCNAWSIEQARAVAKRLSVMIDTGTDPRVAAREEASAAARKAAEAEAQASIEKARAITVASVWPRYLAEGKPARKEAWKPRYRADLEKAAAPGGVPKKRGQGLTLPGHLAPLMSRRLVDIDADLMRDWFASERRRSPRQAARAAAMFSGFLRWCSLQREYRDLVQRRASSADALSDLLPGKKTRTDALEQDQLKGWFVGTNKLQSKVARAYLQALVLTGARREEMAALTWEDVDFRWHKLTIADKVGDRRVIPLTPYLSFILDALPRAKMPNGKLNPFVYAASISKSGRMLSASGHIAEPRAPHADVLSDAGIPHVSIHGLRRTFALMGEAAGAPAGAIAQVMGHRPSAVAEGYKPRSIDALRPHMARVERFILDKAGVPFDGTSQDAGELRVAGEQ